MTHSAHSYSVLGTLRRPESDGFSTLFLLVDLSSVINLTLLKRN